MFNFAPYELPLALKHWTTMLHSGAFSRATDLLTKG